MVPEPEQDYSHAHGAVFIGRLKAVRQLSRNRHVKKSINKLCQALYITSAGVVLLLSAYDFPLELNF